MSQRAFLSKNWHLENALETLNSIQVKHKKEIISETLERLELDSKHSESILLPVKYTNKRIFRGRAFYKTYICRCLTISIIIITLAILFTTITYNIHTWLVKGIVHISARPQWNYESRSVEFKIFRFLTPKSQVQ